MDSRIANTRLLCKLKELQDVICDLQNQKDLAVRDTRAARQVQEDAEYALKKTRAEHKAEIAKRASEYAALQAQASGIAEHNEQLQALVNQHTSDLAAVLEQRSQAHLDLKTRHAQAQQRLQAKSDECLKLHKQLEGQTQVINTIEVELRAVRLEFAAIDKKVAHNEAHVASHQAKVQTLIMSESKLLEQLKTRAENEAQLKHLKANLENDLQCKEAALQAAVEEVKAREERITDLTQEKEAAGLSLSKATERHTGLLDQLQASNDLVQKLRDTCRQQLHTLAQLQQDMSQTQASHMERSAKQQQTLNSMRKTEAELSQTVQELQQRCAVLQLEREAARLASSGSRDDAFAVRSTNIDAGQGDHTLAAQADLPAAATESAKHYAIHVNVDRKQTDAATALKPVSCTKVMTAANQPQSDCTKLQATIDTPVTAAAPAARATTPMTKQVHVSAEQSSLPSAKLTSTHKEAMFPDQEQQHTSRMYRCTITAVDDLSELELDADTGVLSEANAQPPSRHPAVAAPQCASQKRPNSQAQPEQSNLTLPLPKKRKTSDRSALAPATAEKAAAQLGGLPGTPQQFTASQNAVAGCASLSSNTDSVPMSHSSEQPPQGSLSLPKAASQPPQKAITRPMTLKQTTGGSANRAALPQNPDAAARISDSTVSDASQQLVLSSFTGPAVLLTAATSSVMTCNMPATLSSAPGKQLLSTAVAASACIAGQDASPQPSFAPFGRSIVTVYSNSGMVQPNPGHSGFSMLPKQQANTYRPVIEELPSLPCDSVPTALTADTMPTADPKLSADAMPPADLIPTADLNSRVTTAAKSVPPSKPTAIVIDIDSDDEHVSAANIQPASSMRIDKAGQARNRPANLSSESTMKTDAARDVSKSGSGQAKHNAGPSPAESNIECPCDANILAAAKQVSLKNPPAPLGMGDIFSSFAALEDLSDAEEEEGGT